MSEAITVAAAERKQTASGKSYVAFIDANGGKWTSWDADIWPLIKPGAQFDLDWARSRDGKYKNITSMVFRGEEAPPPPPEPAINQQKQASIEAQNARTNLTNLFIAGKLDEYPLVKSTLLSQLCSYAGIHFDGTHTESLVQAAMKAGAVPKVDTGYAPPANGQFKNVGDFLNHAYKEYGLQRPEVEALLGEPVTPRTDLDGAWLVVENSVQK